MSRHHQVRSNYNIYWYVPAGFHQVPARFTAGFSFSSQILSDSCIRFEQRSEHDFQQNSHQVFIRYPSTAQSLERLFLLGSPSIKFLSGSHHILISSSSMIPRRVMFIRFLQGSIWVMVTFLHLFQSLCFWQLSRKVSAGSDDYQSMVTTGMQHVPIA